MRSTIAVFLLLASSLFAGEVTPPAYESIPRIGWYATADEYKVAATDKRFRLTRESYQSDNLEVFAYVYAPAATPKTKLPVIVFNRGGYTWKEFAGEYLTQWHRLAEAGFIVVAPMIRGSGGAEGRDEVGGPDLDDLLNVVALIRKLPGADAEKLFMYGESRGGMMTYQAIREHFPMRAAAVYGGFTDFRLLADPGRNFAEIALQVFPDYPQRRDEIARRRSAIEWPETFETPVLIMHGGKDGAVSPSHSLALATKLQELGKPYQLIIIDHEDHHLSGWRNERDAAAVAWFRKHL